MATEYTSLADSDLITLFRSGDDFAYTEIYHRYTKVLFRHAYHKLHDREEARDVVQQLFVNLWERREDLNDTVILKAYLYNGVRNGVLNLIAHQNVKSKHLASIGSFMESGEIMADHQIRERQLQSIIEKEVSLLPSKMRTVFELSRNEHLSHKEIAVKLSLSEQTVKVQVRNALRILRVKLGLWAVFLPLYFFLK